MVFTKIVERKSEKQFFFGSEKKNFLHLFFKLYTTFKMHQPIMIWFHIPSETHIYYMIELILKFHFSKVKLETMHAPSCTNSKRKYKNLQWRQKKIASAGVRTHYVLLRSPLSYPFCHLVKLILKAETSQYKHFPLLKVYVSPME